MSGQAMRAFEMRSAPATSVEAGRGRPIDLVHLSRQTLGDRDLETELLGLFERQAAQIMLQIERSGGSGDRGLRRDLAHTLKGSARAVGATAVAAAAQDFEEGLRFGASDGDIGVCRDALRAAVDEARAAILALLGDK
jgi:HPt (histidine-containing phosphotransfer) domain-containing protein